MSFVAIVIFIALWIHALAEKKRFSFPLIMVLGALLFSFLARKFLNTSLFDGSIIDTLLWALLIIIAVDVSSRIHHRMWDHFVSATLKYVIIEVVLLTLLATPLLWYVLFNEQSWPPVLLSALFVWLCVASAPSHISFSDPREEKKHNAQVRFLELSSTISELAMLILVFVLLPVFIFSVTGGQYTIHPLFGWLVFGIGAGMLVALTTIRLLKMDYHPAFHSLLLLIAAWIAYSIASFLKGNGLIAVIVFGLCIGLFSLKKREEIVEHSSNIRVILEVLAFFFVAWLLPLPTSSTVYLLAVGLFLISVLARRIALMSMRDFSSSEQWFLSLYAPKGVAFAATLGVLVLIATRIPPVVRFTYHAQLIALGQVALIFLILSYVVASLVHSKLDAA